jgi:hypothetical protein
VHVLTNIEVINVLQVEIANQWKDHQHVQMQQLHLFQRMNVQIINVEYVLDQVCEFLLHHNHNNIQITKALVLFTLILITNAHSCLLCKVQFAL